MPTYRGYEINYTRLGEGDVQVDIRKQGQPFSVSFFREDIVECREEAYKFIDTLTMKEEPTKEKEASLEKDVEALLRVQAKLLEARDLAKELGLEKPILDEAIIDATIASMMELAFLGCEFDSNPFYRATKEA